MMVGVLVAGTRSPTAKQPLSRKLFALEILLVPECKYLLQSITKYNWFILSLNHFASGALKVSEPRLSALLKESPIVNIIEKIHIISIIERIPHYQQPQQDHTDTLLGTAAAYQALLWENTTMLRACIASWFMCVVSHLRMLSLHMPCTL